MNSNVIVFGETGAGKSSVVNMLDGTEGSKQAPVASTAVGVSTTSICYERKIREKTFNIFDTAGLNEGKGGTVSPRAAIEMLQKLIAHLDSGLNLLTFVMRAPRITRTAQQIYRMFYEVVCDKRARIVIVITGLEFEEDRDRWFERNKAAFSSQGMTFDDHACITAVPAAVDAYKKSKVKVGDVIFRGCNEGDPLKISRPNWFADILEKVFEVFSYKPSDIDFAELKELIKSCGGLSDQEAKKLAKKLKRQARKRR